MKSRLPVTVINYYNTIYKVNQNVIFTISIVFVFKQIGNEFHILKMNYKQFPQASKLQLRILT